MAGTRRVVSTVLAATLTVGCSVAQPIAEGTPSAHRSSKEHGKRKDGDAATARETRKARKELAELHVGAPGDDAGYARDRFGRRWADTDHNGCDTRNDILARDLDDVAKRGDCVVVGGRLDDPYTGRDMTFTKSAAARVQIDHIYPLALAWRMGADDWSEDKRTDFANDRDNLLAVWARPNEQKGDSGPSEWRPRKAYRCTYAIKFVDVAAEYELTLTGADHDSLDTMLDRC